MEPEWFYKPIEGYNRRYIRVGEFRQIRWCTKHDASECADDHDAKAVPHCHWGILSLGCEFTDKWLEV